jgi:hypothetical protein
MRKSSLLVFTLFLIACGQDEDEPYFADCPCENVRGYSIKVCEGQDWEEASDNALIQQEKDSNCD